MTPRCGRRRQDAAAQGRNTTGLARRESRISSTRTKGQKDEHGNFDTAIRSNERTRVER
jgi:hypothetical protein